MIQPFWWIRLTINDLSFTGYIRIIFVIFLTNVQKNNSINQHLHWGHLPRKRNYKLLAEYTWKLHVRQSCLINFVYILTSLPNQLKPQGTDTDTCSNITTFFEWKRGVNHKTVITKKNYIKSLIKTRLIKARKSTTQGMYQKLVWFYNIIFWKYVESLQLG